MKCSECKHHIDLHANDPNKDRLALCRRYPPVPIMREVPPQVIGGQAQKIMDYVVPLVGKNWTCGEFAPDSKIVQ